MKMVTILDGPLLTVLVDFRGLKEMTTNMTDDGALGGRASPTLLCTATCCMICDRPNCKLKCSRCLSIFYCSKQCQKQHWKTHKPVCQIFNDICNALSGYREQGLIMDSYNLAGSLAMYLRLSKVGIVSEMMQGYGYEHGMFFAHIWLEVENRIFDFASKVKGMKRSDMEYHMTIPEGAFRLDYIMNGKAQMDEVVEIFRKLKSNENNFRRTWMNKNMLSCGPFHAVKIHTELFTREIVEEVTKHTIKEHEEFQKTQIPTYLLRQMHGFEMK